MTAGTPNNCALAHTLDMGENGLRVVIKDCIDIAGSVSACGSAALANRPVATQNAEVVDAILAKGCKITGKAKMHELAYGMTGVNAAFGTPVNARWPNRIPGGSSSGSAVAVASGICDFAVGTDTGGSVRQPAICCGVFGIKPTFGRISRKGCHPAESSLDCIGVFARSAEMITTGMEAIDPTFKRRKLAKAPRMARIKCDVEKDLGDTLNYALMESLPDTGYETLPGFSRAFHAAMTIIGAEAAKAFGSLLEESVDLGPDVRCRLEAATKISEEAITAAERDRQAFTQEVERLFETYDVLITPALPTIPPTLEDAKNPETVLSLTALLRPFNLSGHPAIVLPILFGPEQLPAGLQLIGRKGQDADLCAIAEWMVETVRFFEEREA